MLISVAPESIDQYFQSFSTYLRLGEAEALTRVFPQADDLSFAAVYRNGFLRACIDALRASYPVVNALVGEEYFTIVARAYVARYPPKRSTFVAYGDRFPKFLPHIADQHQLAYLQDFATLDQTWMSAYFAADSKLLSESQVSSWQAAGNEIGSLGVCLPQSAALITLGYPVSSLWLSLKSGCVPSETVQLKPATERSLVWRDADDQVNLRVTSSAEFAFLKTLSTGATLLQAASTAIKHQSDFGVVEFFSELLVSDALALISREGC